MADKTNMRAQRARSRIWRALPLLGVLLAVAGCGSGKTSPTGARATPTPTVRAAIVYVALGASDALGVGAGNPNTEGYIPRLIARLPARSQALNLGVSGIELHDALARELPQALATQPTLVTVWLSGNDFRDCVPLAQYGKADVKREFLTEKSCAPNCTISCVHQVSYIDHWRAPQTSQVTPGASHGGADLVQIR